MNNNTPWNLKPKSQLLTSLITTIVMYKSYYINYYKLGLSYVAINILCENNFGNKTTENTLINE